MAKSIECQKILNRRNKKSVKTEPRESSIQASSETLKNNWLIQNSPSRNFSSKRSSIKSSIKNSFKNIANSNKKLNTTTAEKTVLEVKPTKTSQLQQKLKT